MSYNNIPAKATLRPVKFEAYVGDEQVSKFKQLLSLSELGPRTYENTTDKNYYGVTYEWMQSTKKYWTEKYDWRKIEAKINSYPNYKVDIEDEDGETYNIHFIALYSDRKDAIPIIFSHGWPGSFLEFLGLIDIVKKQYPSAEALPYHIVVPSLPGYTFSSPASLKKNLSSLDVARIFDKLMHGLGFGDGYIAQGGDIGSTLSRVLAGKYPSCKAAHLNICIMPMTDKTPEDIDEVEKQGVQRRDEFLTTGNAYAREHATRPSTIGFVLSASPLALLAWIGEKFQTWTDETPPLDDILDSVTLYWFTQSFPQCIYPYRPREGGSQNNALQHVDAPKKLGYSFFLYDIAPAPKAWVEKTGNLVWYRQHSSGGHFAAMEKPDVLWRDVEDFVKQVWDGSAKL